MPLVKALDRAVNLLIRQVQSAVNNSSKQLNTNTLHTADELDFIKSEQMLHKSGQMPGVQQIILLLV